jgi:hypothetical protein
MGGLGGGVCIALAFGLGWVGLLERSVGMRWTWEVAMMRLLQNARIYNTHGRCLITVTNAWVTCKIWFLCLMSV